MKKKTVFALAAILPFCLCAACADKNADDENENVPPITELPASELLEKYADLSSHFSEVELLEEGGKYYAVKPAYTVEAEGEELSLKLDLGGIGKGYAADRVNELIDAYGFKYGNFSFGTSSTVCKKHYSEGAYSLGFRDARNYDGAYITTQVADTCISTSGDYERFYYFDGVRYCHVFNPFTGSPVQTGIITASVIGGTAAENDALTTAIMAMDKDTAVEFVRTKLRDRTVFFVYEGGDGYKVYANVPEEYFEITAQNYSLAEIIDSDVVPQTYSKLDNDFTAMQATFYAMDTQATLTASDNFGNQNIKDNFSALCKQVNDLLDGIERSISSHIEGTSIYDFNAAAAGEKVEIDKTAYEVLSSAKSVYEKTDGYYNPAVYYSVLAYGFYS